MTSELNAVRGIRHDNNSIIMDGFDDEVAGEPGDSAAVTQLKKLEAVYEKLKGALIERDRRIEELEQELASGGSGDGGPDLTPSLDDSGTEAPDTLETQLASQQTVIEALQEQVSDLRREKETLEDLATRRSKSNRALKDASAEMEARVPVLEKQIEERDQTIQTREASIRKLLNEADEWRAEIVVRDEKIETLKSEILEKLNEVEQAERSKQDLEASLTSREERISALETELAATLAQVQNLQKDLAGANDQLTAQQQRINDIDTEMARRDQAEETLRGTIRDRDFRIDTLSNEKTTLEQALAEARDQLQEASKRSAAAEREVADSMAISDKRHQAAESEKAVVEQEVRVLKREAEDLKANLTQREQWMDKLKQTLEDREKRVQEQQQRIEELQKDLDAATEGARDRLEERQAADDARHALDKEIVALSSRNEQLQAELSEHMQTVSVYKSMLADKDFRIESLEQELHGMTNPSTSQGSAPQAVH
jgi:chromosome segregation ATPase